MKKEDMKKPYCEERQDFQHAPGYNLVKLELRYFNLLLIFFLFNENIFAQVPINGFCKFNYFKVDSGFTRLLMVNYNDDAYSDLLLYNPLKNETALVQGALNGEFTNTKKFKIPLEISSVQSLNYRSSDRFVFSSRKKRKAGIYELNKEGQPALLQNIEFSSYPEVIHTADVNTDGKNEILVSGGAFNGISLLYRENDSLVEHNVSKGSFSQAAFIELNNDGYPDIAGYDIVNRSINFYYNNSQGEFQKIRSILVTEKPYSVKTFDINLDSYEDIIFSAGNSINIWYGDFASSYESTKKIKTAYKPDKFIYGDFNNDGFMDIAYLNIESSIVLILFAKNETDYYSEIIYLLQKNLRDIIPYYSRFIDGIAALSYDGELYTITHISSFTDDVNISAGAQPGAITFFDNANNGITDFCFLDSYDKKIKFIVRDITGLPAFYFSQQLFDNHEKIIPENLKPGEKFFICFSYNRKLIEIVRFNFVKNELTKSVLYSPGAILDLKVRRENDEEYKIFILYKKNKELNLGVFDSRNLLFSFSSYSIEKNINIIDASLGINGNVSVNYWNEEKGKISLGIAELMVQEIKKPLKKYSLPGKETPNTVSYTADLLNMEKNITISFVETETSDLAVISSDTVLSVIKRINRQEEFRITSKNNLFFGETRFNGLKRLFIYLPHKNIISRLEFIQRGKNFALTKIADIPLISSFFIKNMTSKNYHLVYSNLEKNCISIKRLRS